MQRIALLSVHGCPLAELGSKHAGGMNVYIKELAEGLGRLGFHVDIFTRAHRQDAPLIEQLNEMVRIVHVPAGPVDAPKEALYQYLPAFRQEVLSYQQRHGLTYALVHSHYWLSGCVAQELQAAWGAPHIVTFHTLAEIKTRAHIGEDEATPRSEMERRIAASADRVVVSTAHERGALHQLYEAAQEKVRVVPGGVDLEMFSPGDQAEARQRLGLNGHHTILYVGRLDPIKGVDVLMHSVVQLDGPRGIRVLIVGGDAGDGEFIRLQRLAQDLGIADKVEFLGARSHEALPPYYRAADVCVVPSYYESFGLVALESMACGTPVVASRVPGIQTILRDNRSGYVVPWHCPDAFADRIEVLLANETLRRSMGVQARQAAVTLSWDGTARRVAAVYEELGVTPSA